MSAEAHYRFGDIHTDWPIIRLRQVAKQRREWISVSDDAEYTRVTARCRNQGIELRDNVPGTAIRTKRQQVARTDDLLVAEIDAKVGGIGIIPPSLDGGIVSSHYFIFRLDGEQVYHAWLDQVIRAGWLQRQVDAVGSTNYAAIRPDDVLAFQIPLPPLPEQRAIAGILGAVDENIARTRTVIEQLRVAKRAVMDSLLDSKSAEQRRNGSKLAVLDELISGIEAGSSPQCLADAANDDEWGVLKISAITGGCFKPEENKALPESMTPDTPHEVRQGDVLVCRANGQATLVGSSVYVYSTRPRLLLCDKTWRLLPSAGVDPRFLVATLQSHRVRQQIANLWNSSSGQKNISQESLRRLQIVMRHPGEQQRIGEIFQAYDQWIEAETAYMGQLTESKHGLAQGLLSGAIRCGAAVV